LGRWEREREEGRWTRIIGCTWRWENNRVDRRDRYNGTKWINRMEDQVREKCFNLKREKGGEREGEGNDDRTNK
jgi:hypothetical protein